MTILVFASLPSWAIQDPAAPVAGCIAIDRPSALTLSCCEGATVVDGICKKDPSMVDPAIDSTLPCPAGMGLLPQSIDNMFSRPLPGSNEVSRTAMLNTVDNDSYNSNGNPALDSNELRDDGRECLRNNQCTSYNCAPSPQVPSRYICTSKNICRFAAENESPPQGVRCEPGLRLQNGKCDTFLNPQMSYSGLQMGTIQTNIDNQTCRFDISEEKRKKGTTAIETTRAMEWLLANFTASDDCMQINKVIRNEIMLNFVSTRQKHLDEFNLSMERIEMDQKSLLFASAKAVGFVTYNGAQISSRQLAEQRETSAPMIELAIRKNKAVNKYQENMSSLLTATIVKVNRLHDEIKLWDDHESKKYTLWGTLYQDGRPLCRGGGLFNLGRRRIFKRWAKKVKLAINADNAAVINDDNVFGPLKVLLGADSTDPIRLQEVEAEIKAALLVPNPIFDGPYLLDPLLNITQNVYTQIFTPETYQNLPGDYDYLGQSVQLGIYKMGGLKGLQSVIRGEMIKYLGSLKKDPKKLGYIVEPELLDVGLQNYGADILGKKDGKVLDCFNEVNMMTPYCSGFNTLIDRLTGHVLSSFIAWSYHRRGDYKAYFGDGKTWRRRLLQHWMTQLGNATEYYTATNDLLKKQNECLGRVEASIKENFYGNLTSVAAESKNFNDTDYRESSRAESKSTRANGVSNSTKFEFNNNISTLSNRDGMMDRFADDDAVGSAGANLVVGSKSSSAVRSKTIIPEVNPFSGVSNVAKINGNSSKATNTGTGSLNANAGGAQAIREGAEVSAQESSAPKTNQEAATLTSSGSPTQSSTQASLGVGGSPNFNLAVGNETESKEEYKDPTGMSDEEKSVVLQNVDRNRIKLQRKEDDDLFTIISKQYTNSLPKILTRKKVD